MPDGLDVVREAFKYEGLIENPIGSNLGPTIEKWQAEASAEYGVNYRGAAWCAIAVRAWYLGAGMPIDRMLVHPYTGYICDRADELGGLAPTTSIAPPGSLVVNCSIHVGLLIMDYGNGVLETIDGNSNQQVKRNYRDKSDWRIIVPPGIEHTKVATSITKTMYGFDDLNMKPKLYGPWPSKTGRKRRRQQYEEWAAVARPDWWIADVSMRRGGRTVYAFRTGPPGSYDYPYARGGWPTKDQRKEVMDDYAREHGHRNFRIWSKEVRVPLRAGEISRDTVT